MPVAERRITPDDIVPIEVFGASRAERRRELLPAKKLRRIALGPDCTVYFENYDTMLFQVQEMLFIEGGGDDQLADEMAAYNPMIPQGDELVATIMFEIDNKDRRQAFLQTIGGIEDHFFLKIGDAIGRAVAEDDVDRTNADGKASSVQFVHFPLTAAQKAAFGDPAIQVLVGSDHENYSHMALISPRSRRELARDFA